MAKIYIDNKSIKEAALVLRAIRHPFRQKLLNFLNRREKAFVNDIADTFKRSQSLISSHLSILRSAGFVRVESEGKKRYYCIVEDRIQLVNIIASNLKHGCT